MFVVWRSQIRDFRIEVVRVFGRILFFHKSSFRQKLKDEKKLVWVSPRWFRVLQFALTILVFNLGSPGSVGVHGAVYIIYRRWRCHQFWYKTCQRRCRYTLYTTGRHNSSRESSVALLLRSHRLAEKAARCRVAREEQIIMLLELEGNILLKYEKKKNKENVRLKIRFCCVTRRRRVYAATASSAYNFRGIKY